MKKKIDRKLLQQEIIKEVAFQKYKSIATVPLSNMTREIIISERRMRKKGYPKSYIMQNSIMIIEKYEDSYRKRLLHEEESILSKMVKSIFPGAKGYVKEKIVDYFLEKIGLDPDTLIGNLVANSLENLDWYTVGPGGYYDEWDNGGCQRLTDDLLEGMSEGLMQYLGNKISEALMDSTGIADVVDMDAIEDNEIGSALRGIIYETAMEVVNKYFIPMLSEKVGPVICKLDFSKVLSKLNPFSGDPEPADSATSTAAAAVKNT